MGAGRYNRAMTSRSLIAATLLAHLTAAAALAQSAPPAAEFGSVSGGEVELLTKGPRKTSGSVGLSTFGSRAGYEATLGGTLLEDRLWFFGAAAMLPAIPQRAATVGTVDLKMDAQLGSRNSLSAAFSDGRAVDDGQFNASAGTVPSFLSLRYTGVVSSNFFFDATVMRRSVSGSQPFAPLADPR